MKFLCRSRSSYGFAHDRERSTWLWVRSAFYLPYSLHRCMYVCICTLFLADSSKVRYFFGVYCLFVFCTILVLLTSFCFPLTTAGRIGAIGLKYWTGECSCPMSCHGTTPLQWEWSLSSRRYVWCSFMCFVRYAGLGGLCEPHAVTPTGRGGAPGSGVGVPLGWWCYH